MGVSIESQLIKMDEDIVWSLWRHKAVYAVHKSNELCRTLTETNNTAVVRQANMFLCDIYLKPTYSIEFITLRFNLVGASISFSEVVGKV